MNADNIQALSDLMYALDRATGGWHIEGTLNVADGEGTNYGRLVFYGGDTEVRSVPGA